MSLDDALSKPTQDPRPEGEPRPLTTEIHVEGQTAEVVVSNARERPQLDAEGHETLRSNGLDPDEWQATAFSTSEWTLGNGGQGISTRWSFHRKPDERSVPPGPPLDDLFRAIEHRPVPARDIGDGDWGYVVALGDMQFGKIDGDGAAGTLDRVLGCLDRSRAALDVYREQYPVGHVLLSWLGDHIEGFVSQAGANTWRTPLTLNEQIRLTRRVMLHALQLFADAGVAQVSMAAVPGNHGEPQRFSGNGITRYDDSHDTESLIAVADAARLGSDRFNHVRFYVPETDEMTVTLDVAGTVVSNVHGHQWRTGKRMEWWRGQAFSPDSPLGSAHLLLSGHGHHFDVETDGRRMAVQSPAMESESTWWRHRTGTGGDPGLVVALTRDGVTPVLELVRPTDAPAPR